MMMNPHVILSVFLTVFVGNNNNNYLYRSSSSSRYKQQTPPHAVGHGITAASLVQHKHNNHPQHFECESRLTCLAATSANTDTASDGQLSVEGQEKDAARRNNIPQHQPQKSLKAETATPGFVNTNKTTTTTMGGPFMDRVRQLLEFRQEHGHCLVPKRHVENPALGNWVNKQRQEFKRFQSGKKPCALTPERIHLLESIGMCWDASAAITNPSSTATSSSSSSSTLDEHHENDDEQEENAWQEELQEVKNYMQAHNLTSVMDLPRQSSLNVWIKQQREKYSKLAVIVLRGQDDKGARDHDHHRQQQLEQQMDPLGGDETKMTTADATARGRIQQLSALDCDWYMTRRQAVWECRFRELETYYEQYGDCCVPISYKASPQLAHWVSNQRKLYNQSKRKQQKQREHQNQHGHQHQQPSPSPTSTTTSQQQQHYGLTTTNAMTEERLSRLERLQAIGFVWNRWDYEFAKKR